MKDSTGPNQAPDDHQHEAEDHERRDGLNDDVAFSTDDTSLLVVNYNVHHQTKVYKRRWYILFLVSIACCVQSLTFNAFGPVAPALEISLGWPTKAIALVPGISNAGFVLTGGFFLYLVFWKDLRFCMVTASGVLFLSSASECLGMMMHHYGDLPSVWPTTFFYVGACFNGMAASVFMSIPAFLSSMWFPVNQRTAATAIATNAMFLGVALSFIVGPGFIGRDVTYNETLHIGNLSESFVEELDTGFMNNLFLYLALTSTVFIAFIVYFPAKPPLPPTESAALDRLKFSDGFRVIMNTRQFWLQSAAFCLPNGLYNAWLAIMSPSYSALGIDLQVTGLIGFSATLGGVVGGMVSSKLADQFKKRLRGFIIIMTCSALVCMTFMALIFEQFIKFDLLSTTVVLGFFSVLANGFINGCTPLAFEMVCDTLYPISENFTVWALCTVNCLVGLTTLLLFLIPGIGHIWIIWAIVGALVCSIPLWVLVKPTYARLLIDMKTAEDDVTMTM